MKAARIPRPVTPRRSLPERLLPWTALLGAVLGALFTGAQYLEAKDKARVDRVFDYVKDFKGETISRSHAVVQAAHAAITEDFRRYAIVVGSRKDIDKAAVIHMQRQMYYGALVQTYRRSAEFKLAVNRLTLFYEEIAICAEQGLCQPGTTRSFFGSGAAIFLENIEPIICQQRLVWNDPAGAVTAPAQQRFFSGRLTACSAWPAGLTTTGELS